MLSIDLSDQTVLVTGAATGIGQATAVAFGKAGAQVAVNHLDRAAAANDTVATIKASGP